MTQTDYVHASRSRRSSHLSGDDREQAILATAARLLQERPLGDFSVDELAKGAGISRPTFYFYFPSKNAVLLSLMDQVSVRARGALKALGDKLSGDPTTHWRPRIEAFFEIAKANIGIAVAGAAAKASNSEVRQLWATLMQQWVVYTAAAIQAERDRGIAPDNVSSHNLATALTLLNERVMESTFTHEDGAVPEDQAIDTLVHIWEASIYNG
uniref:HTH-type transcriptional regulator EthR n=1 Tax=Mycobacterium riyadhense TaxID=486698 RepID=A0A653EJC1_9MYCO|nr:HTH-type transcriptional regulator EthR [Mycobacterium riyadhense]